MNAGRWVLVEADLFCPTAISPNPGRIVLFARNVRGELVRKEWHDGQWTTMQSLGIPVARDSASERPLPVDWHLSACCDRDGHIELFGRSPGGDIVYCADASLKDLTFQRLGAPAAKRDGVIFPMGLTGPPAACGSRGQRVDIFAIGQTAELLRAARDGGRWSDFEPLGAAVMHIGGSQPQAVPILLNIAACRCGDARVAVFLCTSGGALLFKWWDGRMWSGYACLGMPEARNQSYPAVMSGAPLTGPPAACSWSPERLDVFARGPRGELMHKAWNGKDWAPFTSLWMPTREQKGEILPVPLTGVLAACSSGPGRLDVFATALDGNLYQTSREDLDQD
jgi:hypothetical protein